MRTLTLLALAGCQDFAMTHQVDQDGPVDIDGAFDIHADLSGGDDDATILAHALTVAIHTQEASTYVVPTSPTVQLMTQADSWTVTRIGDEVCISLEIGGGDDPTDVIDPEGTYWWNLCHVPTTYDSVLYASNEPVDNLPLEDADGPLYYESYTPYDENLEVLSTTYTRPGVDEPMLESWGITHPASLAADGSESLLFLYNLNEDLVSEEGLIALDAQLGESTCVGLALVAGFAVGAKLVACSGGTAAPAAVGAGAAVAGLLSTACIASTNDIADHPTPGLDPADLRAAKPIH